MATDTERSLQLRRPLAVIDIESTGTNPKEDRIVELAVVRLTPDGDREVRCRRINPGRPIPPEATAVHGITDADVADAPAFRRVARSLHELLDECDLAGFGIARFDLPLLQAEFRRCDLSLDLRGRAVLDALAIYHHHEPRDLSAAYRLYCDAEHDDCHRAESDALAVLDVLAGQLSRYDGLPTEVEALAADFGLVGDTNWADPDGRLIWHQEELVVAFGKHEGRPLSELKAEEPDYLQWILQTDFPVEVKRLVAGVLNGQLPRPPEA